MAPAAERHLPDSRHSASGAGTTSRGLYLTLARAVLGQHGPSTAIEFSRIGPKSPLRPRGELIPAWIRSQAPIARALCGCPTSMGD